MEAPRCKICEKRHYGLCADAVVPEEPRARKKKKSSKPKVARCGVCGKRHEGSCWDALTTTEKARRKAEEPAFTHDSDARPVRSEKLTVEGEEIVEDPVPLWARVEALEKIVAELCGFRKKRSAYMKQYMRDRRAEKG